MQKSPDQVTKEAVAAARPLAQQRIADSVDGLVFVKTHAALVKDRATPTIDMTRTAGAIYVVRNPLDVAISYAKHLGMPIARAVHILNMPRFDGQLPDCRIRVLRVLVAACRQLDAPPPPRRKGEGGFYIAPLDFLRALCDDHNILLIAEIQTGFARTGKMFALEHTGVKADIVTLAKGLAGGLPLSAVTGRADVMDAAQVGGLGGTYAGNPLACAAAHAVLDLIAEEKRCERSNAIGKIILDRC